MHHSRAERQRALDVEISFLEGVVHRDHDWIDALKLLADGYTRRGRIEGMTSRKDAQVVKAIVPLSEMFGYSTRMRSMTQGRAIYTMQFAHYDEVPRSVADEIIEKVKGK